MCTFPSSKSSAPKPPAPGALLKPSPYPVHTAEVVPSRSLPPFCSRRVAVCFPVQEPPCVPAAPLHVLRTAGASSGGWGIAATGWGPSGYNGKAGASAGIGLGGIPARRPSRTCHRAPTVTISCGANISHQHWGAATGTVVRSRHRAACREIIVQLGL